MTAALSVSGLSFAYRDSLVLREVTLDQIGRAHV